MKFCIFGVFRALQKYVDFVDFEGRGLERYTKNVDYLIRPDGYIVGIFKNVSIKKLERYML